MAIGIDAQILIWGIKRQATPNRQQMIPRAERFFRRCKDDGKRIYVPAQSLAELLVGYSAAQRRQTLATLPKSFLIAPFDAKAAAIAAELQHNWDHLKQVGSEYGITRQQIKADINVLASAIAAGASYLYSEDGQMKSFAQGKIIVCGLPEMDDQKSLFG